jgi:hypothetical protein
MPAYYFDLITDHGLVRDAEGTDLRDDREASGHARSVVLELMRYREAETQTWQLHVYDAVRRRRLRLPFDDARLLSPTMKLAGAIYQKRSSCLRFFGKNVARLRFLFGRGSELVH